MKIGKNLEGVFLVAAVLATFGAYATTQVSAYHAPQSVQLNAAAPEAKMQVVVIKGQRLSAAEKAQLG